MKTAGLILAAIGAGLIWMQVGPSVDSTPQPDDCLTQSYAADRAARVAMLREMEATEFPNDAAKAEWHNEKSREVISEAFAPYIDAVAEAITDSRVLELADELDTEEK